MQIHVPDDLSGRLLHACCSRRGFLRQSLFAGVATALTTTRLRTAFAADRPVPPGDRLPGHGKAQRAIFIYLAGGPSHIDTFDPKPGRATGGPFTPVKTPIPGVVLGEHLPRTASRMLDIALIRSMTSKEGNHSRARTLVHTGYPPEATVKHPAFGSAIAAEVAPDDFELPSFVSIGPSQDGPAFLGVRNAPFVIGNPERPPDNMEYHDAIGKARVERRLELLGELQDGFAETRGRAVTAGQDDMFAKAKRLMDSPLRTAFDLDEEDAALREAYGANRFGQGVLMARRLAEAGVSCTEIVLGGWDTHDDNFTRVAALCSQLDAALSTLLADLSDRGMLDSTFVACFGEFGRTPRITERNGRDHWAKAWSALLAGGGVLGGQVIGETDADGNEPASRPVEVADLHASIWHAFGVDPWTEYTANDRPILLTPKEGRVVEELFV